MADVIDSKGLKKDDTKGPDQGEQPECIEFTISFVGGRDLDNHPGEYANATRYLCTCRDGDFSISPFKMSTEDDGQTCFSAAPCTQQAKLEIVQAMADGSAITRNEDAEPQTLARTPPVTVDSSKQKKDTRCSSSTPAPLPGLARVISQEQRDLRYARAYSIHLVSEHQAKLNLLRKELHRSGASFDKLDKLLQDFIWETLQLRRRVEAMSKGEGY